MDTSDFVKCLPEGIWDDYMPVTLDKNKTTQCFLGAWRPSVLRLQIGLTAEDRPVKWKVEQDHCRKVDCLCFLTPTSKFYLYITIHQEASTTFPNSAEWAACKSVVCGHCLANTPLYTRVLYDMCGGDIRKLELVSKKTKLTEELAGLLVDVMNLKAPKAATTKVGKLADFYLKAAKQDETYIKPAFIKHIGDELYDSIFGEFTADAPRPVFYDSGKGVDTTSPVAETSVQATVTGPQQGPPSSPNRTLVAIASPPRAKAAATKSRKRAAGADSAPSKATGKKAKKADDDEEYVNSAEPL